MTKKSQKKWWLPPVSEVKVFLACPSEKAKISERFDIPKVCSFIPKKIILQ